MGYYKIKIGNSNRQPTRQKAAALEYQPERDSAPRVVASGQGVVAEKIIALAKENGVPVYEDPTLAAALATVNINDEIPPELYLVVAEVLAYIYRISRRAAKQPER